MAEVYRGLHVGHDGFKRLVAIKRILTHYVGQPEFAEMFRDEAHIGQRLQHANIVKVECYAEVDGAPSIIMEYVDGPDLRSLLAEVERNRDIRRMPIPMSVFIIAEAARGLHYAHTRADEITQKPLGIVHRDISPQNILLSFEGEVKVTDFGIAATQSDFRQTETKAGIVKGKYSYMSPEQISAKGVDARTDVFALSVVLWEMLAMRRLFSSDNEVETIELVRNCRIGVRLKDVNKNVDEELEAIVSRGLAKDPRKRFQSAEEFEKDLRRYLSKKFATFTVDELGAFIKTVCARRREDSVDQMKKMLTSGNLKAATGATAEKPRELLLDSNAPDTKFSVAKRPYPGTGRLPFTQQPNTRSDFRNVQPRVSEVGTQARSSGPLFKFMVIAALLAVVLVILKVNHVFTAHDMQHVLLQTTPSTVRVHVDNLKYGDGSYVRSPKRLDIPTTAQEIRISRPGYQIETIRLPASGGDALKVQLKAKVDFSVTTFILQGAGNRTWYLDIGGGFATGVLSPANGYRLTVPDLADGIPGEVQVRVDKSKGPLFSCRFVPKGGTARRPSIVAVDPETKRCSVRNP